jgi:hypothetical protein
MIEFDLENASRYRKIVTYLKRVVNLILKGEAMMEVLFGLLLYAAVIAGFIYFGIFLKESDETIRKMHK